MLEEPPPLLEFSCADQSSPLPLSFLSLLSIFFKHQLADTANIKVTLKERKDREQRWKHVDIRKRKEIEIFFIYLQIMVLRCPLKARFEGWEMRLLGIEFHSGMPMHYISRVHHSL